MMGIRPAVTSLSDVAAPCALAEQLAGQMRLAAPVGGGELHSARRFIDEPNQFRHSAGGNFLVHGNGDGLLSDHADRHKGLLQIDLHLAFLRDREDREGRGLRHVERIAVLLDSGRSLRGDQAAGAGTVEHDDLIFPQLRQAIRDQPGDDVRAVARGCRGDECDGFDGIALRARRQACERRQRRHAQYSEPRFPRSVAMPRQSTPIDHTVSGCSVTG
jgi:hypothetical protein